MLSGLAMVIIGVWLTAQAIGGNLAGRIRSWASGATTGGEGSPPSSDGSSTPTEPSGAAGTGGGGSRAK